MEMNKSLGLRIFAILLSIFALINFFPILLGITFLNSYTPTYKTSAKDLMFVILIQAPLILFFIVAAYGLWTLKRWGRILAMLPIPLLYLIMGGFPNYLTYTIFNSIIYVWLLFYLTRPKIKAQFK